ncbi:amino acid adenylation domain-containing protein, partial [Gordonia caeni]|uniref:amino acid adenylation domain-containing protein n=1 Tax=Gordonia caeni TaxID=1007097 RepID=UPI0031E1E531
MWLLNQLDVTAATYNIPLGVRLRGEVDVDALIAAVHATIARHEILRTVYPSDGAQPAQRVLPIAEALAELDWAEVDSAADLMPAAVTGFDMTSDLPIRGRVRRVDGAVEMMLVVHHIAFDGESIPVLMRDVLAAYAGHLNAVVPPPLPVQYADYAIWEQQTLGNVKDATTPLGRQMLHWREKLDGLPVVTDLPMDRPRPTVFDSEGAVVSRAIDPMLADRIDALCQDYEVTPFVVTYAALAVTISRLASTADTVVASPTAGRMNSAVLDNLVGMFVNTLVLRIDTAPGKSVDELLREARTTVLDAFDNSLVQFDDLVEALAPPRSPSYSPIAQIAFTFTDSVSAPGLEAVGAVTAEPIVADGHEAKFDLMVLVHGRTEEAPMTVDFLYSRALFDESTVVGFVQTYLRVLDAMTSTPDIPIGDIEIVGRPSAAVPETSPSGVDGTGAAGGDAEAGTLIDVLKGRDLDLHHPALIYADHEISYEEFEGRTNAVARSLLARGVAPDDIIAVGMERSIDAVVAVWGVIKAGAAYLSIDPAYPDDRIRYMLDDSSVELGITTQSVRDRLGTSACTWIELDELAAEASSEAQITDAERNGPVRVENLAYMIYTSGSTGRPKGVAVSNSGVRDLVAGFEKVTGAREDDPDTRVLHVASPSFDASFFEMAWAITAGHTLVIAPHSSYAGELLDEVLESGEVTDMVITPSVLATLDPERAEYLRNLATAGEACPPELVDRWSARGRRVFNFYGPSETTVWATRARMLPRKPVTIGRAISGFTARVLDQRLHEVPQGIVGELYLSAKGLARGYRGRPGLTSTAFVADPEGPAGTRMYATGDLVRVNRRGDLEFAGRADDQVKINGQRVELGEVEAVLAAHPGVDQAVVVGHGDEESGRVRLVGYVVSSDDGVDVDALLAEARNRLATHMVPTQLLVIAELPLTPGGKLDRDRLPVPAAANESGAYIAPNTPDEQTIAQIVSGLVGVGRVSATDSFFALGGDSIMSIQLASAAKAAGLALSPKMIFENQTVRAMARAAAAGGTRLPALAEPEGGGRGEIALPPMVSWMIGGVTEAAGFADFSQSAVLVAGDDVDLTGLTAVVDALVKAHPMLSARLTSDGAEWRLSTEGEVDVTALVSGEVCDADPASDTFSAVLRAAHSAAADRLDPAGGKLVQAVLVRSREGGGRILLVIHHLAVDAVSWPIIIEDLVTAWAQWTEGRPLELRPEATTARAWFGALTERTGSLDDETDYWIARSPERPTPLATVPRTEPDFGDTDERTIRLDSSLSKKLLTTVPEAFDGAVTDVLLAAMARAVRSWQRAVGIADDRAVGVLVESHGRYEDIHEGGDDPRTSDLSRTVGWFTSIAPFALDPAADMIHAVKAAKEERLGQPRHGLGFGVLWTTEGSVIADRPLPSIAFNYFGGRGTESDVSGSASMLPAGDAPALPSFTHGRLRQAGVVAVNVHVAPGDGGPEIVSSWAYPDEPEMASAVDDIVSRWRDELAAVVAVVTTTDPGLSPSDVPGSEVTQADLDLVAERFPGARVWPMTTLQKGLLFQSKIVDGEAVDVYVTQATLDLVGDIDVDRLQRAAAALLDHHPALRSSFVRVPSGAWVTVVPQSVDLPWRTDHVPAGTDAKPGVADIALAERLAGFDLQEPPLIRLVLVRHDEGASLIVTNHHILFDGWSGPLVLADLLSLYATGTAYTGHLGTDFGVHAKRLADTDPEAALHAWREVLAPLDEPTLVAPAIEMMTSDLPQDYSLDLPDELAAAIERRSRELGTTTATVLQFAWAVLVSRLTGSQVVSFGETVSGRPSDLDGAEHIVGLFINTLPVVVDVDPAAKVADVIATMRADKVAVLDYQHVGLPELMELAGHALLFDTLTVFESYPVDTDSFSGDATDALAGSSGLQIAGLDVLDATHYPLNMAVAPRKGGLTLTLKYRPAAFDQATVAGFADALATVLAAVSADPGRTVADVPLVAEGQSTGLLPVRSAVPVPAPSTMDEMFVDAARRAPDRVAVRDSESAATYAEIDDMSNRMAQWLRTRGVHTGSVVAVAVERSTDLLVAVWAVAKAGAAYMPVDPAYPTERIASMVTDSGAQLGLVGDGVSGPTDGVRWYRIDSGLRGELAAFAADPLPRVHGIDDLAYVIYTSGSTGRPKGVAITHRGLRAFAEAESAALNAADGVIVLGYSSPSFDASILELLLVTANAGTLVYRPAEVVSGEPLAEYVRMHGVTHLFLTPQVLATVEPASMPDVVGVGSGGEAVPQALVDTWASRVPIVNMYGPSEASVAVAMSEPLGQSVSVHLGTPVPGTGLMVLDERLRPVPVGVNGELYVVGQALARGYLNRHDLTAERFVADPHGAAGARMYRTGDVVRWRRGDGDVLVLEYSGRSDGQVKVRGLRIELGEIESVMAQYPGVRSAVVIGAGGPVATVLNAYVVADEGFDAEGLREHLRGHLPLFMVPSSITVLDALPLTPVGKLDRNALPVPAPVVSEYVAPVGEVESTVVAVFS